MLRLLDFEELYHSTPGAQCLPITDLATPSSVKTFISTLFSTHNSSLGFVAQCDNGCTVGNFYEGAICPKCGSVVRLNFSTELRYKTWVEIPEFMPPVLHPAVYEIFIKELGKSARSVGPPIPLIDHLLDPEGELPPDLEGKIIPGMRSFYDNFWSILETLATEHTVFSKAHRQEELKILKQFLEQYRDRIFTRKLPCLDPSLHLMTQHRGITLTDDSAPIIISAITTLSGVIHIHNTRPNRTDLMDQKLWKFYAEWTKYPRTILSTKLATKKGLLRKIGCGGRTHCSFRGVIVPIFEKHIGDELHIPWKVAIRMLKLEIINFLTNRKKQQFGDAADRVYAAETSFDQEIYDAIQTLIRECPYKGLPVLFNRNPSIQLGCMQLLFITEVGNNPSDSAIGISPRVVKAPNADFDGDQMNGFVIKEMGMIPDLMKVHPMCTMLGGNEPAITGNVMITSQESVILQAYLAGERT